MFLLLFIPMLILSFVLITIWISNVYNWFYYENINYLLKEKLYVEIRLEKFFKKSKIKNIFTLLIYILNIILILLFILLHNFYKKELINSAFITFTLISILMQLFILTLIINIIKKTFKLKKIYEKLINSNGKVEWESYFLDINNINVKDHKFDIVKEYIQNEKINFYYLALSVSKMVVIFPKYKKLKKILKNKSLIKDKYLYLNSLLAIEPLKLKIKKQYLDREQISYLYYLIMSDIVEQ